MKCILKIKYIRNNSNISINEYKKNMTTKPSDLEIEIHICVSYAHAKTTK